MARWKYLLVVVALVSWFAKLSLYNVSDLADRFWYLSLCCWFALFFLAWSALFRGRWLELVIFSLTLAITFVPALNVGVEPINRLQDQVFRIITLHRIRAVPLQEFLTRCKLIDYVEDDGAKGQVGECDTNLRNSWPFFNLIYDPTRQFALPGYRRTIAWRLALKDSSRTGLDVGLAGTDRGKHLIGDFYYVKVYLEDARG